MASPECSGPDGTCQCVASPLLERLGTKYAMDVLCVIGSHDPVRFSTIEEHVPRASTSTLSARLDELEDAGLIERERYDEIPPRVEYGLSEEGHQLSERLRPLFDWLAEREEDGGRRSTGDAPDSSGVSRGGPPGERGARSDRPGHGTR